MQPRTMQHVARERHLGAAAKRRRTGQPWRFALPMLLLASTVAATGCGGGSSSPTSTTTGTTSTTTPTTLQGVVASGAPVAGAQVILYDNSNNIVAGPASTKADGSYTLRLPAGASPPLLVVVTSPAGSTLSSLWPPASGGAITGTVNVTPLTNLLASTLSANGNPALAGAGGINLAQLSSSQIAANTHAILSLIAPVQSALGTSLTDLISGPFVANGNGVDLLLDSLQVSVLPNGSGSANVQMSVNQVLTSGAQPTTLVFTSSSSNPPPSNSNSLAAPPSGTLVPAGLSAAMQAFVVNFNTCMAQPVATRANGSALSSSACAALVANGNSADYLSNGKALASAWPMLFNTNETGGTLSNPQLRFGRMTILPGTATQTATWVFTAAYTSPATSLTPGAISLVRDNYYQPSAGAALVLLGDQNAYGANVRPIGQYREFVNDSQPDAYWSSGYTVTVGNRTSGGVPIFSKVVVTPPQIGTNPPSQITLVPTAGCSFLVPQGYGCTNFLRYDWGAFSTVPSGVIASNPADPSTYESLLFQTSSRLADADVVKLPDVSSWKFEFYLASNPTAIASTQYYRTSSRMLTLGELQAAGLPQLSSPTAAQLAAGSTLAVNHQFSSYLSTTPTSLAYAPPVSGGLAFGWNQKAILGGAVTVFGYDNNTNLGFNDSQDFYSAATSATVVCSDQTISDLHCHGGNYVAGTGIIGIELSTSDADQRDFSRFYALYKLY